MVLAGGSAAGQTGAELLIESGPGGAVGLRWEALDLRYGAGEASDPRWTARMTGVETVNGTLLGEVAVVCRGEAARPSPGCQDAQVEWTSGEHRVGMALSFSFGSVGGARELIIEAERWTLEAIGPGPDSDAWRGDLSLRQMDLGAFGAPLAELLGLALIDAELSGTVVLDPARLVADLTLSGLEFDTPDGLAAGAGLALSLSLNLDLAESTFPFEAQLRQDSGELLAGPVYLPSPRQPLSLSVSGRLPASGEMVIDDLSLSDPKALEIGGRGRLRATSAGWVAADVALETISLELPLGWERWLEGPVGASGFAGLQTAGRISAEAAFGADRSSRLSARLASVSIRDPADRLAVEDLTGTVSWDVHGPAIDLAWQGATLYDLPLREARLRLASDERGPRLIEPLRLPLFDGALVLDQLRAPPDASSNALVEIDARIEPVSLSALTRQLGLPEFGGQLSGRFPGIRLAGDRIDFTGGIDINAFSGSIRLADLVIERPFGTLPALATDVTLTRLDLLQLTGAFNFGRMEGQASGWMRGLRLLDWQPVAMDARVFTLEDVPRRRISQRAVENLSSLGGAGGALMTGTFLTVFEDFPYRRAGLACRLANNICHVDGVAPHESGGFYIVEGRGLPRLDVIGHRRLVDWPLLLRQLETIVQ
jgi:hypothetical protein